MFEQQTDVNLLRWAIYFVFGIPFLAWLFLSRSNVLRVLAAIGVLVIIQETFVARRYLWAVGVGPSNITMYVALVSCLMRNRIPSSLGTAYVAWAGFIFLAVIGMLIGSIGTPYLIPNWLSLQNFYLEGFLWFLLGLAAFSDEEEVRRFLIGMMALGIVEAAVHLFCLATGYVFPNYPIEMQLNNTGFRYGALFTNVNNMGNALAPLIPISLMFAFARRESAAVRLLARAAILVMLPSLLLSAARGPYLITAVMVLMAVAWSRSDFLRTLYVALFGAMLVILGVALTAVFLPDLYDSTTLLLQEKGLETPRLQIWAAYSRLIVAHPFGVGLDELNVKSMIRAYGASNTLAHNIYLDLAARIGILGLLAFLALVGSVTMRLVRTIRSRQSADLKLLSVCLFFLVASFLMGGFFEPIYQNSMKLVQMFWLFCGISLSFTTRVTRNARAASAPEASLFSMPGHDQERASFARVADRP